MLVKTNCSIFLLCSGCRADANEAAVVLLPSNITVFTLDFSGSGLSDGDYVSLGWHEVLFLCHLVSVLLCVPWTEVKTPALISEKWPQGCDVIFEKQWESFSHWPLGKINGCSDEVGDWLSLYLRFIGLIYHPSPDLILLTNHPSCRNFCMFFLFTFVTVFFQDCCSFPSNIQFRPNCFKDGLPDTNAYLMSFIKCTAAFFMEQKTLL